MSVGQELASVPIGDMITSLGIGIARAQFELDQTSADIARMMSGINPDDRVQFGGQSLSLIELGFTPTFYQFIESTIEVKIVVNMEISSSSEVKSNTKTASTELKSGWSWWYGGKAKISATTTTVDAKYSNKYDYSVEGSSLVKTKLVPVPPPAILEERIRVLMDEEARVRFNAEVRRLLGIHKDAIVGAINGWDKRLSPSATIDTIGDLQGAILTANPSYRDMVQEYPDIMANPAINTALGAKFRAFQKKSNRLKESLREEIQSWTPDIGQVYATAADVKNAVLESLSSGLRTELSFHKDILIDTSIQNALDDRFKAYQNTLTLELVGKLNTFVPALSDNFVSAPRLMEAFLKTDSNLAHRLAPHPSLLVDTRVDTATDELFEDWLVRLVVERYTQAPLPIGQISPNAEALFTQFLTSDIDLNRKVSALPQVLGASSVLRSIEDQFDAYIATSPTPGPVFNKLIDAVSNWANPDNIPIGSDLTSAEVVMNEFFIVHPQLEIRSFSDMKATFQAFEEAEEVTRSFKLIAILNLFQTYTLTDEEIITVKESGNDLEEEVSNLFQTSLNSTDLSMREMKEDERLAITTNKTFTERLRVIVLEVKAFTVEIEEEG